MKNILLITLLTPVVLCTSTIQAADSSDLDDNFTDEIRELFEKRINLEGQLLNNRALGNILCQFNKDDIPQHVIIELITAQRTLIERELEPLDAQLAQEKSDAELRQAYARLRQALAERSALVKTLQARPIPSTVSVGTQTSDDGINQDGWYGILQKAIATVDRMRKHIDESLTRIAPHSSLPTSLHAPSLPPAEPTQLALPATRQAPSAQPPTNFKYLRTICYVVVACLSLRLLTTHLSNPS